MRGFILIAMIAVISVSGRPEAPLSGYNYNQPAPAPVQHHQSGGGHSGGGHSGGGHSGGGHSGGGHSGGGHSGGGHSGGYQQAAGYSSGGSSFSQGGGYSSGGSSAGGFSSGASNFGGNSGFSQGGSSGGFSQGGSSGGFSQGGGFSGANAGAQQTIVQKHIYVHVPPPEDEVQIAQQQAFAAAPRKHYKIIFIKAPSAPSITQQVAAAQAQNSEKTLIYVLVKKPEEINFEAPQEQSPLAPSKPEVYFIKYKTQKDASSGASASSFGGASGSSGSGFSSGGGDFSGSSGSGGSFSSGSGSSFSSGSGFASSGSDYSAPAPQNPQSSYGVPHKK